MFALPGMWMRQVEARELCRNRWEDNFSSRHGSHLYITFCKVWHGDSVTKPDYFFDICMYYELRNNVVFWNTDELGINWIFTFNLSKEESKYHTRMNFLNTPPTVRSILFSLDLRFTKWLVTRYQMFYLLTYLNVFCLVGWLININNTVWQ